MTHDGHTEEIGPYEAELRGDHISIWRKDGKPCNPSWYTMWRFKNLLLGVDKAAIEIYPAARDLVDGANERHMMVAPRGFKAGRLRRRS